LAGTVESFSIKSALSSESIEFHRLSYPIVLDGLPLIPVPQEEPEKWPGIYLDVVGNAQKEREKIVRALTECNGRVGGADGAAALMGIHRTTLISRMKKLGIGEMYVAVPADRDGVPPDDRGHGAVHILLP
jgi:transcriptional regulator with GAF, ATPase, and Fis domain